MASMNNTATALAMFLATGAIARAAETLPSYTVDGGGATWLGGGGSRIVRATAGQPDAAILGGGGYVLEGGFWHAGQPVVVAGKTAPAAAVFGGTVGYEIDLRNAGDAPAEGVTLADALDPNTTLVAGSINVSPIAYDDDYQTPPGTTLAISDPAEGVLQKGRPDRDVLGEPFTLAPIAAGNTTAGGVVDLAANGTFVYRPPSPSYVGVDTFTYTLTDAGGLTGQGTVSITVGP